MKNNLYYTSPSEEIFKEMKNSAITEWKTFNDDYNYSSSKISRIEHLENTGDNFMYMLAMFDIHHQVKVVDRLSKEAKEAVINRIIAGGGHAGYLE